MAKKTTTAPAAENLMPMGSPELAQAPTAGALPVDEFHGVGGSYVIENGVRRRVEGPPIDTAAERMPMDGPTL